MQRQMATGAGVLVRVSRQQADLSSQLTETLCRRQSLIQLMCRINLAAVAVWLLLYVIRPHQGTQNTHNNFVTL